MKHLAAYFPLLYLDPKQCHVARAPTLVSTILGSCVAITMFDPVTQIGGIAHAFLPTSADYPADREAPCKFVDDAVEHLLSHLAKDGAALDCVEVKLFGGAEVMNREGATGTTGTTGTTGASGATGESGACGTRRPSAGAASIKVGARNVEMALALIKQHGLQLAAKDVGGQQGRKLLFLSHTGGAWVKKL